MSPRRPPPWRPECRRVARVLQAYLDGELGPDQTDLVLDHLRHCQRCGIDARIYTEVKRSLRALATPASPQAIHRLRTYATDLGDDPADAAP